MCGARGFPEKAFCSPHRIDVPHNNYLFIYSYLYFYIKEDACTMVGNILLDPDG